MSDLHSTSFKASLDKAETYALSALASSLVFVILCFPEAQLSAPNTPVKWQLLGFPLDFQPALALVVLYFVYVVSCLLADNMLIHVRDLATRMRDRQLVSDLLMHPTVLTVSPLGTLITTVLPTAFILLGLWRLWSRGQYILSVQAWLFVACFGLSGLVVYLRAHQAIATLRKYDSNLPSAA